MDFRSQKKHGKKHADKPQQRTQQKQECIRKPGILFPFEPDRQQECCQHIHAGAVLNVKLHANSKQENQQPLAYFC